jgi:hypothetical protein
MSGQIGGGKDHGKDRNPGRLDDQSRSARVRLCRTYDLASSLLRPSTYRSSTQPRIRPRCGYDPDDLRARCLDLAAMLFATGLDVERESEPCPPTQLSVCWDRSPAHQANASSTVGFLMMSLVVSGLAVGVLLIRLIGGIGSKPATTNAH